MKKNWEANKTINVQTKYALLNEEVVSYQDEVNRIHDMIDNKTGAGNDFLGWVDWPDAYDKEEFERIIEAAEEIKKEADVLLVCGIGGSYLGARSAIEMTKGLYPQTKPEFIFIGNTFSSTYLAQVCEYIKDKSFYVNVISKSGTTTETSIAFRVLKNMVEETYGEEASKRILATTDKARGTLKALAQRRGIVRLLFLMISVVVIPLVYYRLLVSVLIFVKLCVAQNRRWMISVIRI